MQQLLGDYSEMRASRNGGQQSARLSYAAQQGPHPPLSMAERWTASMVSCPWSATAGSTAPHHDKPARPARGLYTPEERLRRDATGWTMVQGVLAPIQFLVFLISLGLVLNYLAFGTGYAAATASVVIKTGLLYLIMVTGSIWEKKVFGKYLFARAFFYEDLVSMLVIALHTAYIMMLLTGHGSAQQLMILALAAYASYAINATQFLLKLRAARLEAATLGARA